MSETPPAGLGLMDAWAASDYLGISRNTFDKHVRAGLVPVVRLGGKRTSKLLFMRADLDAFVAAATTPATAGPLAARQER